MHPVVSIIIPTRDRPRQLRAALESVCCQTFNDYEIIVVDDASSLDMSSVIMGLTQTHSIKIFRHDVQSGASSARNTGLSHAQGEFVAFLDDDDRWLPRKLELQLQCLVSNNDFTMVGSGYSFEINGIEQKRRLPVSQEDQFLQLLQGNWIGSTSIPLVRREKLVIAGEFDTTLSSCQDWDLWLRLCQLGPVAIIPEVLVVRSIHGGQMTNDILKKIEGRKQLLDKYRMDLEQHPRYLAKQRQRLGTLSLLAGDQNEAKNYFDLAIKAQHFDYISHVGRFLSLFPPRLVKPLLLRIAVEKIGTYYLYH